MKSAIILIILFHATLFCLFAQDYSRFDYVKTNSKLFASSPNGDYLGLQSYQTLEDIKETGKSFFYITKFQKNGDHVFSKEFIFTDLVIKVQNIFISKDNSYLISGLVSTIPHKQKTEKEHPFLLKLDKSGNCLYSFYFEGWDMNSVNSQTWSVLDGIDGGNFFVGVLHKNKSTQLIVSSFKNKNTNCSFFSIEGLDPSELDTVYINSVGNLVFQKRMQNKLQANILGTTFNKNEQSSNFAISRYSNEGKFEISVIIGNEAGYEIPAQSLKIDENKSIFIKDLNQKLEYTNFFQKEEKHSAENGNKTDSYFIEIDEKIEFNTNNQPTMMQGWFADLHQQPDRCVYSPATSNIQLDNSESASRVETSLYMNSDDDLAEILSEADENFAKKTCLLSDSLVILSFFVKDIPVTYNTKNSSEQNNKEWQTKTFSLNRKFFLIDNQKIDFSKNILQNQIKFKPGNLGSGVYHYQAWYEHEENKKLTTNIMVVY